MSDEETPVGLKVGERFFGLLVILVGFIVFYFAYTSYSALSGVAPSLPVLVPGVFLFVGAFFVVIGFLLIFARSEEE